jgi:hypothetical protein
MGRLDEAEEGRNYKGAGAIRPVFEPSIAGRLDEEALKRRAAPDPKARAD